MSFELASMLDAPKTDFKRRLGQVKYTGTLLDDNPEVIQLLYSNIIPLDLRYDIADDSYFMKGLCKAFRKIAPGEVIPSYKASFNKVPNKALSAYDKPGFTIELYFEEVL